MTTDTLTRPRRALLEPGDSLSTPQLPLETPASSADRPPARPHLPRRGAWGLIRSIVSDDSRRPGSDPLLLLGPSGGPIWSSNNR